MDDTHETNGSLVFGRVIVPKGIANIVAYSGNFALTCPVNASPVNSVSIRSVLAVQITIK